MCIMMDTENKHYHDRDGGVRERGGISSPRTAPPPQKTKNPQLFPPNPEGFGFNVMGGKEQKCPIYISRIIPGGYADKHGDNY